VAPSVVVCGVFFKHVESEKANREVCYGIFKIYFENFIFVL